MSNFKNTIILFTIFLGLSDPTYIYYIYLLKCGWKYLKVYIIDLYIQFKLSLICIYTRIYIIYTQIKKWTNRAVYLMLYTWYPCYPFYLFGYIYIYSFTFTYIYIYKYMTSDMD